MKEENKRKGIFIKLLRYYAPYKMTVFLTIVITLVAELANMVYPMITKYISEGNLTNKPKEKAIQELVCIGCIVVALFFTEVIRDYMQRQK